MDARDLRLQRRTGDRIQRAERFVHQQHLGIGGQRARYPHPLLLPAGQLMRVAAAKQIRLQMQQLQQFGHPIANAHARPFQQLRHGGDVLLHRPVREQADRLDRIAHAPPQILRFERLDLFAGKENLAPIVFDQAIDHF